MKRIPDSSAWDSTLIIITYDENGGRWDHMPPPPISSLTRPLSGRLLSGQLHRLLHNDVERHHKSENDRKEVDGQRGESAARKARPSLAYAT